MKKTNKKKNYYGCDECARKFRSVGWVTRHMNEDHPFVAPPPPKRTMEEMSMVDTETHRLENGVGKVGIGDSINVNTKYVIRKTIVTEGSCTVVVELEKVRGIWRKN